MTRLILTIFTLTAISFQASALDCVGISQWLEATSSGDKLMTAEVTLVADIDNPTTLRMSADIGDTHFFIQGNKKSNDYLMMITLGPDYTRGVTNYAIWDKDKGMRLTRVDGDLVYKLKCK